MKEPEKIAVITKNQYGDIMSIELPWDANMNDFIECFKVILYWLTFPIEQIEEAFQDENTKAHKK